ncbi:MAG: tetrahydrofolate dehydrogenase/cyclohydrolase catalytic domain-containing protein [Thermomicrobiales bacterium]
MRKCTGLALHRRGDGLRDAICGLIRPGSMGNAPPCFDSRSGISITAHTSTNIDTLLLRGGDLATTLRSQIRLARMRLLRDGGRPPVLVTLAAEPNASAEAYRTSISRTMKRVEIEHRPVDLPAGCRDADLERALQELSNDPEVAGVLVLMPLPARIDSGNRSLRNNSTR